MAEKLMLRIPVIAEALVWVSVLGSIQLALRHPQFTGPSAAIARGFASELSDKLLMEGVLSPQEMALMMRDQMLAEDQAGRSV